MKTLKNMLTLILLIAPFVSFSQENASKKKSNTNQSEQTYQKKTTRKTTTTGSVSSADTIRKENAPILQDNGVVNTTGAIDGGRSSTGRPDADTMVNYSVKKTKKTMTTGRPAKTDSTKKNRKN